MMDRSSHQLLLHRIQDFCPLESLPSFLLRRRLRSDSMDIICCANDFVPGHAADPERGTSDYPQSYNSRLGKPTCRCRF